MTSTRRLSIIGLFLWFLFPMIASAHEHQVFKVGDSFYRFTVGSLSEPLLVDDKAGVDLTVIKVTTPEKEEGAPVTGLESSLKVELVAGDTKKTLSLEPAGDKPGAYEAVFIPTVATTLSYRFFGTIEGKNVDITFTCSSGADDSPVVTTPVNLPNGVTRIAQQGAFGCPEPKDEYGFPETSMSIVDLKANGGGSSSTPLILSVVALALSVIALAQSRKRRV